MAILLAASGSGETGAGPERERVVICYEEFDRISCFGAGAPREKFRVLEESVGGCGKSSTEILSVTRLARRRDCR